MGDLLWVINQVDRRPTPRQRQAKPQQPQQTVVKSEPKTYVATRRKSQQKP